MWSTPDSLLSLESPLVESRRTMYPHVGFLRVLHQKMRASGLVQGALYFLENSEGGPPPTARGTDDGLRGGAHGTRNSLAMPQVPRRACTAIHRCIPARS